MKKMNKTLVLAMGTTLITGLTSVAVGAETTGIFEMTELSNGYMQLAAADTDKAAPAKPKATEGKCAGAKPIVAAPKAVEAKCGEGKCGDAMKKAGTESAKSGSESGKEGSTKPADTKASEGKCGEGKCGDAMKKTPSTSSKPADANAAKK